MLVISTPALRACCSNQQLSGCAAWLIRTAKVQSWFFFATPSICLSSHLLLSRSRLPDCALSYSPSAHTGGGAGTWTGFTRLSVSQCNSIPRILPYHGQRRRRRRRLFVRQFVKCLYILNNKQRGRGKGRGGAGEIQLQSFMGHSWVTGCGCNVVAAVASHCTLGVLGRFSSLGMRSFFTANSYAIRLRLIVCPHSVSIVAKIIQNKTDSV